MWVWLADLDWPTLLLALAFLVNSISLASTNRKIHNMAGEVAAVAAKIDEVAVAVVAVQAKVQALHDASASGIDPAAVVALGAHLQTAVLDPLNAIVATPAPPVGSAPAA